ncbi:hypothetical protein B0F90DRAFT_378749 [Multifurca ochricompacta]|uniref:Uncharacterized protein n=1 Tax=Multifurca ochricompacta TaxID=376703 RepID=A0AAD4QNI8_9AGAM|nr:hypothetical protein B0F90DRAFT_378749 [Multifurca ochricompacta]
MNPVMATDTFPLKYRRKSSPPPSPRMLSPIAHMTSSFPTNYISRWLDSDDDLEHEPALTSDDAFTVPSSGCSRAPSMAPLETDDAHVDIVSSPAQETFFRSTAPPRAPFSRHNKPYPPHTKLSTTREDVAAALLALHAQPRFGPSRPAVIQSHPRLRLHHRLPPVAPALSPHLCVISFYHAHRLRLQGRPSR